MSIYLFIQLNIVQQEVLVYSSSLEDDISEEEDNIENNDSFDSFTVTETVVESDTPPDCFISFQSSICSNRKEEEKAKAERRRIKRQKMEHDRMYHNGRYTGSLTSILKNVDRYEKCLVVTYSFD